MIRLPPRLVTEDAFTDVEALQTDVMRFMAILGLCLTAIFALVQTFPRETPRAATPLRERIDPARHQVLQSKLRRQQQALADARADLDRAGMEKDRLQASLERAGRENDRLTTDLQRIGRENHRLATDLQRAGAEQGRLRADLKRLRQQLQAATVRLDDSLAKQAEMGRQQQRQAQAMARLRERLAALQKAPAAAPLRPATVPDGSVTANERPTPEPPLAAPPTAERAVAAATPDPGFILRFASPEALQTLVQAGTVRVLALQGGRSWSYRWQQGRGRLAATPMPVQVHEMTADTVPPDFRRALASAPERITGQVTWAVELPAALERQLQQSIRGRSGGVLEIQADGSLRLKGEVR